MSPIDPREIRATPTGSVIQGHRACPGCGYDLHGLKTHQPCPECGREIKPSVKKASKVLAMSGATAADLRVLSLAFGIMFASLFFATGALAFERLMGLTAHPFLRLSLAVCWWVGVSMIVPRPRAGKRAGVALGAGLRWSVKLTQFGWVLAAVAATVNGLASPNQTVSTGLDIAGAIGLLAGMAGTLPLLIVLERLADWSLDESLGERLRFVAWWVSGVGVCFVLAAVTAPIVPAISYAAGAIAFILLWPFLIAIVIFLLALWQLCSLARWGVHSLAAADAKERRIREKAESARARAESERVPTEPAFQLKDEQGFAPPPGALKPATFTTHRIEPAASRGETDEGDPYDLSPE